MSVIHISPEILSLLEGTAIPLVVSLLVKSKASPTVKSLANAFLSALAGAATTALAASGVIDWQTYALDIMSAFLASVTAYHGLWNPTGSTDKINLLTGDFGIGPSAAIAGGATHFVGAHTRTEPDVPAEAPASPPQRRGLGGRRLREIKDEEDEFKDWMGHLRDDPDQTPEPSSVKIIPAPVDPPEVKEFFQAPLEQLVQAESVLVRQPVPPVNINITNVAAAAPVVPAIVTPTQAVQQFQEEPAVANPTFDPASLLGRIYVPDERDRNYLMSRRVAELAPVGARLWPTNIIYNQGQTPMCTGYSSSGALSSYFWTEQQITVDFDAALLYAWANANDGIKGAHDGSTVRAAFQGLVTQGDKVIVSSSSTVAKAAFEKIQNFLWADVTQPDADIERIITWILTVSPVVIGINWYNDMFTPVNGYVTPTGGIAGGHAIMVRGVNALDPANTVFVLRNSWGSWGVTVNGSASGNWAVTPQGNGDALITKANLISLLQAQGECGALVDALVVTPAPTPTPAPAPAPPLPTPTPAPAVVVSPALEAEIAAILASAQAQVLAVLKG